MDTRYWGPDGWKLFHTIAMKYPLNPYEDDIITFDGYNHSVHQCEPMQRRVVIVFTYS